MSLGMARSSHCDTSSAVCPCNITFSAIRAYHLCSKTTSVNGENLQTICDGLVCNNNTHRLSLVLEGVCGQPKLYRVQNTPRRRLILETQPAISLERLLQDRKKLALKDKRRLALVFAYSLLRYHTSSWLPGQWGKRQILFFHTSDYGIDVQSPYISTFFEPRQRVSNSINLNCVHREPAILALGILLIEIDLGQPIEEYRVSNDSININTNWIVADRVVKTMDQCSEPYRNVIRSCLEIPWIPAGQHVSLEDRQVREGLYDYVIEPLEKEYQYLFPGPGGLI